MKYALLLVILRNGPFWWAGEDNRRVERGGGLWGHPENLWLRRPHQAQVGPVV